MLFDNQKNAANIGKHGVSFEDISALDWQTAVTRRDDRFDYGEIRYTTFAMRDNRLHCLIWTVRDGLLRPISFRKANLRERKIYEKEKA